MAIGIKMLITGAVLFLMAQLIIKCSNDDVDKVPTVVKWITCVIGFSSLALIFIGPLIAVWL